MDNSYATRKPNGWFWSGQWTRDQLLSLLFENRIDRNWLVCPFGEAKDAVTVGEFVDDPDVFRRLKEQTREKQREKQEIAAKIEKPRLLRYGKNLVDVCLICLAKGRVIVAMFFPEMVGAGLSPTALLILVPIWSIGGVGLLALLVGWLQHQYRIRIELRQKNLSTEDGKTTGSRFDSRISEQ